MEYTLRFIGICAVFFVGSAAAAPFQLGDSTIQVNISGNGGRYTYVHLHENESTALQAAHQAMRSQPGRLIALSHGGGRMVNFRLNGKAYQFDPNRIFTDAGLHRTLNAHSRSEVTPEAIMAVRKLASTITSHLGGTVIALHNNANDTVMRYIPGGAFAKNAGNVNYSKQENPHNFFLVTNKGTFEALKAKGFNVVLQSNRGVDDDGSLSVYCGQRGIPYINIEAAFGALGAQTKMLTALP